MKSCKKSFVFPVALTPKDIINHSLKPTKVFSQQSIPFKANIYVTLFQCLPVFRNHQGL